MNREIVMDKNMQELNPLGDFRFPFDLMHIVLSNYSFYNFPCHWHQEIEITYVLEGEMILIVNQSSYHLKAGDCLFVNTNVLHSGEQFRSSDCKYVCLMFNPILVYGFEHSMLKSKYISPILEDTGFDHTLFTPKDSQHPELCHLLNRLIQLNDSVKTGRELYITSVICELWCYIYEAYTSFVSANADTPVSSAREKQILRLKNSLTFIYEHYADTITLEEMAAACHTSKSEFSRLFKQTLHQTPFDFLLRYRVEQSLPLLCNTELPITEIATRTGFSGPSYYAEVFRKYMQCSPTSYKKKHAASQFQKKATASTK